MCRSSLVMLALSRRLVTTRGSPEYSGRTLMSAGSADICVCVCVCVSVSV